MLSLNASNTAALLREEIALCRAAYEAARRPKAAANLKAHLDALTARLATLTAS